jgi:hypothetical protein
MVHDSTWCRNLGKNWCNFAYALKGSSVTSGTPVSAAPGSKVRTHCKSAPHGSACAYLVVDTLYRQAEFKHKSLGPERLCQR